MTATETVVLGSQSPRRRQLMESILGPGQLRVMPPQSSDEAGFDGCFAVDAIETRLRAIVSEKHQDVSAELVRSPHSSDGLTVGIVADTIVVAGETTGRRHVLGKPALSGWQAQVRHWFRDYLSGADHEVWTCYRMWSQDVTTERVVKTRVSWHKLTDEVIDWYVSTEESIGKAGGYAIQERAAMFVSGIQGSLTNVIGLPLYEIVQDLRRHGLSTCSSGVVHMEPGS